MKISLKWLNEYVDVKEFFSQPQKLADLLTHSGLEVDAVTNLSEQFHHVVVGHVTELGRHPDADKLTVCQIDAGEGSLRQIICGAKNHKAGDKVVVCLPGAILPGNFSIKDSKIRGVDSKGMLASESELGLSKESEGILILPKDAPVGRPFAEYMGLDDVILEISVTPNRADCLSHLGLAREVACLLGRPYKVPVPHVESKGPSTKKWIHLSLQNSEACPRYAGRGVFGVKIGPSPQWLKSRLEAVGLNSINNVVDVTNYVMLEMGQPLHAFDAELLRGKTILVNKAQENETFTTLDGTELKLTGEELTIRDGHGPVALAGVIGGKNSGVSESTRDVFVESAFFSSGGVRHTSRRFGLDTDSSQRFSRGTDPDGVLLSLNRACELIQKVAGGTISEDFYDAYPNPIKTQTIEVSLELVEQRLGYAIEKADFLKWMQRLGCHAKELGASRFSVQPPAFRWDLRQDVDLIEEYGRLNGYDKIPETFPSLEASPSVNTTEYTAHNRVADLLVREGYLECVNYRFLAEKYQNSFLGNKNRLGLVGVPVVGETVRVRNPLSEELGVMRESLLPGLFQNLLHNYRHGKESGRLFELDFVFGKTDKGYEQKSRLSLMAWGQREALWDKAQSDRPVLFDLKASLDRTLGRLLITSVEWRSLKKDDVPEFLHPKQCAGVFLEGRFVGFIGSLHPKILSENKIRHSVAVAELDMLAVMRGQPKALKAKSISKFPTVERDLAVVMPSEIAAGAVVREIQKAGVPLVQSVEVFDVYTGGNLGAGERSVTFRMLCQKMDGTLSDDELKSLQMKVIETLQSKLKLSLR
jgi:phenylalanyl-tRNA synthetase beta chain